MGSHTGRSAESIFARLFTSDEWIIGVTERIGDPIKCKTRLWWSRMGAGTMKGRSSFTLTNDNSRNGQEHKGISDEESFHVLLGNVPYSLPGQLRPQLDPVSDVVKPILALLLVLPIALSHLQTFLQKTCKRLLSDTGACCLTCLLSEWNLFFGCKQEEDVKALKNCMSNAKCKHFNLGQK